MASLKDLIEEAKAKNPFFRKTMEKKHKNKKKNVPMAWLMKHLESILGRGYVIAAAQAEIDAQIKKECESKLD